MAKRYGYILILAIGIAGLILVTSSQQVSATKIDGLWKLNANGEKADLNISVRSETPSGLDKDSDSGLIKGTAHWFGSGPGGDTYTQNVIGFWDSNAKKIVFLTENKIVFDNKQRGTVVCNTVEKPDPSLVTELRDPNGNITKALDKLEACHGRDVSFTGYLFGDGKKDHDNEMAGVEQTFAGGSAGVGGYAERNTFGWCATQTDDLCGGYKIPSATNATSTTNMTETAK